MRAFLFVACLFAVACGGAPGFDTHHGGISQDAIVPAQPSLTGHWQFGPMVGKGYAGTPGRLADLTLSEDGRFDLLFGAGCLLDGAAGQWTSGTPAVLTLSSPSWWTDEDGSEVPVSSVRATYVAATLLTPEGLRIDFTDAQGHPVSQFWDRAN